MCRVPRCQPELQPPWIHRRGKGLKFINATHVVGLLGSAVQPPYRDYRLFIWSLETPTEVSLYKVCTAPLRITPPPPYPPPPPLKPV